MTKLARPITRDEVAAYRLTGVVLLRGLLDLATVNSLRRCIDEAARHTSSDGAARDPYEASLLLRPEQEGDDALDPALAEKVREFRRFTQRGPGPEIAASLLGGEQITFYGERVALQEPGIGKATAFHQDAAELDITGDQCCVLWIPVDPVGSETGTMMFWRGSHKSGTIYLPQTDARTPVQGVRIDPLPDLENGPEQFAVVHFDVEPGDVIVHHYRTVHGAGGNLSRYQVRRAASLSYCGDDIRFRTRPWAPPLSRRVQLKDGDPLAGPGFPVVWRRRQDQQAA